MPTLVPFSEPVFFVVACDILYVSLSYYSLMMVQIKKKSSVQLISLVLVCLNVRVHSVSGLNYVIQCTRFELCNDIQQY